MVVDLGTLADTLVSGTREGQIERDIRDNAESIAKAIERQGYYENTKLGFRVSVGTDANPAK